MAEDCVCCGLAREMAKRMDDGRFGEIQEIHPGSRAVCICVYMCVKESR